VATTIPEAKRGHCTDCNKPVWRSKTSAANQRCRECQRSRRANTHDRSGYRNGCRCAECRRAAAAAQREYGRRRTAEGRKLVRPTTPATCVNCGSAFMARVDNVHAGGGRHCSIRCANITKARSRGFAPKPPRKSAFRQRAERLADKAAAGTSGGKLVWVQGACIVCASPYLSRGAQSRYCSLACRDKNRSRSFGLTWLDRMALFARDGWACQLCSEPVDYAASPQSDWYPTLDHIVPRSKGGGNEESNLRTAHRWCNSVRGDTSHYTDADLAPVQRQSR
jgi:5-methylcytosine-specific restriction endonuclease McrA